MDQRQESEHCQRLSLLIRGAVAHRKQCLHFFVPLTLRATLFAALRMVPVKPLPLTAFPLLGLEAEAALFALEGAIRALTGLLDGAFLAAGLRGRFVCA